MKSILHKIVIAITILAGLAAIYGVYLQSTTNGPIIEIKTLSSDKLTTIPNLDGLNANYTYKNKPVNSLWKLHYIISNIGEQTIIGKSNNKNIIKDNITFSLKDNFKILKFTTSKKEEIITIQVNQNIIHFSFLQWRQGESINLTMYVEQINDVGIPNLTTDDREIINGEVSYSSLLDNIDNSNLTLFYRLPQWLQKVLRLFIVAFSTLIIIIITILWIITFIEYINFNIWKKENKELYKLFIEKLITEESLKEYCEPNHLPYKLWKQYQYTTPTIPDNSIKEITIVLIAAIGILIIPLLLLIKL